MAVLISKNQLGTSHHLKPACADLMVGQGVHHMIRPQQGTIMKPRILVQRNLPHVGIDAIIPTNGQVQAATLRSEQHPK